MQAGRVMVIVADPDLRNSLEFALGVEGYAVTSRDSVPEFAEVGVFDCTVLDHQAASKPDGALEEFLATAFPVVLLAGRPSPWLSERAFSTVRKPLLGETLLEAVRTAVAAGRARPK